MRIPYTILTGAVGAVVGGSVGYLLTLLGAAALARWDSRAAGAEKTTQGEPLPEEPLRITVIIPAHDEELVLAATLNSLKAQDYPTGAFKVLVVADNCTDSTAELARRCNAGVMERVDPGERGKGYALAWAFTQLLAEPAPADAYCIVDADTWVAPDFLSVMAAHLSERKDVRGFCALQGRYGVLNRQEGWRAALMSAALDLYNHVRPLGADRLGLSVGLKGNGMAFSRQVLEEARWQGRSITEDIDYGLELLWHHNIQVGYVPGARVLAQMPTTAAQAASQRERWERGRYQLLRQRALPLLLEGLRRPDLRLCEAAVSLMVPPMAELAALLSLWGGLVLAGHVTGWLLNPAAWYRAVALSAFGLGAYVAGGLYVADAPAEAYRALARAPFYAAWKLSLYVSGGLRRLVGQDKSGGEWVRTERAPASSSGTSTGDVPAENAPAENAPAENAPAENAPAENAPAENETPVEGPLPGPEEPRS